VTLPFRRVTVLGIGLIGGSFALAMRRHFPEIRLTGWDRPEVLEKARVGGFVDETAERLDHACAEADLVYVALPISETLRRLPEIARAVAPATLVTDACSTKLLVCRMAERVFDAPRLFVGGHPIAGRERSGLEAADADLFAGSAYVLVGSQTPGDERVARLQELLLKLGARPVWLTAETHDRLVAYLSHLPQFVAVALADTIAEQVPETAVAELAGPGLRDTLRLAGSPAALWEDIGRTSPFLTEAFDRLLARWEALAGQLGTGRLREAFERARRVYAILRRL
jgi:prephenate dehydrogenase